MDYQAFWESFEVTSRGSENYLRTYLEGPAVATIVGLTLTKENYATAVELLRDRYGNKQMITSSHMDSMLKMMVGHSFQNYAARVYVGFSAAYFCFVTYGP